MVVAEPQGFGLSVVRLLRTDCLGLEICMGSENDESDYSLGHCHQGHHHHLEVLEGFPPLPGGSMSSSLSLSGGPSGGLAYSS